MKFINRSRFSIIVCAALVSGCNLADSNVQDINKIKSVVGMTKSQVKDVLGTPESASDKYFTYRTIQPDTGSEQSCWIWFQGGPTVSSVDC